MAMLDTGSIVINGGGKKPVVGEIKYENGEVLIYTDDNGADWKKVSTSSDKPFWSRSYYVFSIDDDNKGIWSGVVDDTHKPNTWTLNIGDDEFYELNAKIITKEEYETMIAFEAIPVVEIERESPSGILLKFPE